MGHNLHQLRVCAIFFILSVRHVYRFATNRAIVPNPLSQRREKRIMDLIGA